MKRARHPKHLLTDKEGGRLLLILSGKGRFYDGQAALQAIEALLGMLSRAELVQILSGSAPTTAQPVPDALDHELVDKLSLSVNNLDLSPLHVRVRVLHCLENVDISHILDLVQRTERDLLRVKDFGNVSLKAVKKALANLDLGLSMALNEATIKAAHAQIARKKATGK